MTRNQELIGNVQRKYVNIVITMYIEMPTGHQASKGGRRQEKW